MRKAFVVMVLAGVALAPSLSGQISWEPPKCDLKEGTNQVHAAMLSLKDAAEKPVPAIQTRDMSDAFRSLTQALGSGQSNNPAAWYYLGRYYVMLKDGTGADSAFRKAEALLPANLQETCKTDIAYYRRNGVWVPLYNAGVAALNAQKYDSALLILHNATRVFDGEPQAFTAIATVYFNMPAAAFLPESTFRKANPGLADSAEAARYTAATNARYDSAAKYFGLGAQAASDPKFDKEKRDAVFNLANAFYAGQHFDSAAAAFAEYLRLDPNDATARARLADVLADAGHKDSAMVVYASIIQHADSAEPSSLFGAGVSIYNAAPALPDTSKLNATCRRDRAAGKPLTVAQRRANNTACQAAGTKAIQERDSAAATNYRLAAQAFEAALSHNAQNRDGLFNLASSYLALRDADKMLAVAQRLTAVDPMNRSSIRLVAYAWQLKHQGDSALYYITLSDSLLPVDVNIVSFGPNGDQGIKVGAVATNFHAHASTPVKVVFEFLNDGGSVIATASADIPAIDPGGNHQFELQAAGAGITAWRYKKG